jgi:hypothetical protein
MEKVVRLINILDEEVVDQLVFLDRLVRFYSKFLSTWRSAEVTSDGKTVRVKFFKTTKYGYEDFTERIFPIEDIGKRIASYKGKIKIEFNKRHDNVRIQREKDVRKWQKHIDNAEI